ncbi:MAG: hypothetical protein AB8B52_09320 [Winogradskyella sp.]|uniref:hypothetical protein n=1 Tax=Winogradskyella sp. TaxID=1883156 RepID=UPI003858137E
MPKQKGIIKLKGTLNGMCYYQLNGKDVVRKAVGPSRERINTDPAFANVKSNNQEFAAASKLSKAIRQGLGANAKQFKDTYMASRLTGACRKIIQKGSGNLGQRDANVHNHPEALVGFQLNKAIPLTQLYTAKPVVSANNQRTTITVNIAKSAAHHLKQKPTKATHVQMTVALSTVSSYQWQPEENNYKATHPEQNGLGSTKQTPPLACATEHSNLNLQLQTPITENSEENIAITVWLGITYLQEQNHQYLPIQTPQAMQCIAVV